MAPQTSFQFWTAISAEKTKLHDLIELLNRRLGIVRIPAIPNGLITLTIDGGGAAIVAPTLPIYLPMTGFDGKILGWTMMGDNAGGSCQVDIWKSIYPVVPTVANTITAAAKPALVTQVKNQALAVPTWLNSTISSADVLAFFVDNCSLHKRVTLALSVRRGKQV